LVVGGAEELRHAGVVDVADFGEGGGGGHDW
jgi:hypothetical protein